MDKLKALLKIWFLKYWYLLVLCLSLCFGLYYFFTHEKHQDFYICRMQGSTYMISNASINQYMESFTAGLSEQDYVAAELAVGVKPVILQKIKTILFSAQPVIEETNIRYEYVITITAYDTAGFYLLEKAFMDRLSAHPLVQENYNNKKKKFEFDKDLILADIQRVDSTADELKNKQSEYYEILMQKKVDLNLQLSKLTAKFNENYIHKKIFGFRESTAKINQTKDHLDIIKWLLMFLVLDLLLVFIIDKQFRNLIFF